jgi:hypothetical protein
MVFGNEGINLRIKFCLRLPRSEVGKELLDRVGIREITYFPPRLELRRWQRDAASGVKLHLMGDGELGQ